MLFLFYFCSWIIRINLHCYFHCLVELNNPVMFLWGTARWLINILFKVSINLVDRPSWLSWCLCFLLAGGGSASGLAKGKPLLCFFTLAGTDPFSVGGFRMTSVTSLLEKKGHLCFSCLCLQFLIKCRFCIFLKISIPLIQWMLRRWKISWRSLGRERL